MGPQYSLKALVWCDWGGNLRNAVLILAWIRSQNLPNHFSMWISTAQCRTFNYPSVWHRNVRNTNFRILSKCTQAAYDLVFRIGTGEVSSFESWGSPGYPLSFTSRMPVWYIDKSWPLPFPSLSPWWRTLFMGYMWLIVQK